MSGERPAGSSEERGACGAPAPWFILPPNPPQGGAPSPSSPPLPCWDCSPYPEPLKPQLTLQTSSQTQPLSDLGLHSER